MTITDTTSYEDLDISLRMSNLLASTVEVLPEFAKQRNLPRPATVGALCCWTLEELRMIPGAGLTATAELEEALSRHGFQLALRPSHDGTSFDALEFVNMVVQTLRPLPIETQVRVIRAAALLLELDFEIE